MINNRDKVIAEVARNVRSSHDTSSFEGLKEAATDRGFVVIESQKVIIPSTWYRPEIDKIVILTRRPRFSSLRQWFMAHELGHALLGHQSPDQESAYFTYEEKEIEAEMFSDLVRRKRKPKIELAIEASELLATRPRQMVAFVSMPEYREIFLGQILRDHLNSTTR